MFEAAPRGIKFALGENVKQANWGERFSVRYPQTRMGVEQTYYNYFTKAKEYTGAPRKDLELDATRTMLGEGHAIWLPNHREHAWNRDYSILQGRAKAAGIESRVVKNVE